MLISKVSEEAGGEEGRAAEERGDHAPEYQTASELFELMTRNTRFDSNDDDTLTTRDLVLLYKNIDIGTKLMNDATGMKHRKPNQYVETIVYNDEPESESDTSEIYTADDVHNVFMINQERLDILNDKSLENLLCHKLGGLEIKSSDLSMDYDRNFLFKDPYIQNQLKNLNVMTSSSEFDDIFSTSLIDYICCKRLEDNYNFYMDNIIRYVQHTIEQLKRISNGDYLTDRAKEKWREVNSNQQENNTKVLATSTSIPLHVECKRNGNATWDDIVHSEVDVRSLSKILEKKIVVEIPKLICGSYRLYSKRCADNLIISCKREQQKIEKKGGESRVDVVLQLQRSQTGQVMSNISSVMILRTTPALPDLRAKELLPAPFKEQIDEKYSTNDSDSKEPAVTVIEVIKSTGVVVTELKTESSLVEEVLEAEIAEYQESQNGGSIVETNDYPSDRNVSCDFASYQHSSESSIVLRDVDVPVFPTSCNESSYNLISPDELRMTMQRMNMQSSVLDESGEDLLSQNTSKRRSPVRVRIKSPYENKSFLMEEKKRKRLLEIRERREKKKIALSESCKISKHKYGKSAIMPQASSSVTKLSITNKSFYNSIYGQNFNAESKPGKPRKAQRNVSTSDVFPIEETQAEYFESPMLTPEKNSKKYINRSYYLDDAETEMMFMQMKQGDKKDVQNACSASNSVASNESTDNLNLLKHLIGPSDTNLKSGQTYIACDNDKLQNYAEASGSGEDSLLVLPISVNIVPENTSNEIELTSKKSSSGDECRKSIDQLYDLIKKFGKPNVSAELKITKSKVGTNVDTSDGFGGGSTIQGSDSGTSVKHHVTSSNHSCFSVEKNNTTVTKSKFNKNQSPVVPKVVISSKVQSPKIEADKTKKDRKKSIVSPPIKAIPDNPLKAISQLLHEFDNVQKTRQKPAPEVKSPKKTESVPNDSKTISRPGSYRRRSRLEEHLKDNDQERKVHPTYSTKDRRTRPIPPTELARNLQQQNPVEDKNLDRTPKKKIADIIDEAKEARGEAVRGPSKFNARLNSLAQPKKSYVQAHHEEYQNRYGKNLLAERLQRLAAAPAPERSVAPPAWRNRMRRSGPEATSAASVKHPASSVPHLDKGVRNMRQRRSASSSPERQLVRPPPAGYTQITPDAPETITRKMVAVESYIKSHYGRSLVAPSGQALVAGHRSRVPLMPQDLELESMTSSPNADEATELGDTLHRMINCMLTTTAPLLSPPRLTSPHLTSPCLSALPECAESSSKPTDSNTDTRPRSESDFAFDILEDKNLKTAVETITDPKGDKTHADVSVCPRSSKYDLRPLSSSSVLEKLESALYSQLSGTFQKRLRIKNLTLTPKHSMQQVFLVQSGDAGSVLVKSTVSNLKMNKCSAESLHDLKEIPVLSNSHLDWTFTQIPVQIATVGYAFPEYQARNVSTSKAKLLDDSGVLVGNSENAVSKAQSDKTIQCFKGVNHKPQADAGAQVKLVEELAKEFVVASAVNRDVTRPVRRDVTDSQMRVEMGAAEFSNETISYLETVEEVDCPEDCDMNMAVEKVNKGVKETDSKVTSERNETAAPDSLEYTTSLDMLVGILNEIQKITCQNQMAAATNNQNCANLETILKDTVTFKKAEKHASRDLISISSLDNLRQLESTASICSFYISNDEDTPDNVESIAEDETKVTEPIRETIDVQTHKSTKNKSFNENMATEALKPASVDKEVSANICIKTCVDTCTDVPSSLMPSAVSRSAAVSGSAIGVISEPSTQSITTFTNNNYHTLSSNMLFRTPSIKKVLDLPQIGIKDHALISRDKTDLNEKCFKSFSSIQNIENVKMERSLISRSELRKYCVKNIDLDPMFKIKRDILVTVYSILVLTVFAALSFPELIIFQ